MSLTDNMLRLDVFMVNKGFASSREVAKKLISSGAVRVNGNVAMKPAQTVDTNASITVEENDITRFVSRGALKLEGALDAFRLDVTGMTAVDFGASTGGFTDLLLQRGASHVYAIENGHSQLHPKLLEDKRVTSVDNTNARYIEKGFIELCDIAVMDVSFISQTKLYNSVANVLKPGGIFISLVKPQFEAGKQHIGKNGIVKNIDKLINGIMDEIKMLSQLSGLHFEAVIPSPILGGDGNKEYLAYFKFEG